MSNPQRGRVYRRCACRDATGKQLGARCPKLAGARHGRWAFAVDMPSLDGRRRTKRRSGFSTRAAAQAALGKVLEYERTGIVTNDKQTVADYLAEWLHDKTPALKSTTTARYAQVPRPPKHEPGCWTPGEAARFLRWCHDHDDPLADLFEVLVGTGLRKGEALALHWNDIDLDDHVLFVRYTLSNVNNTTPVFTTPKTKTSRTWIGLSDRVATALRNRSIMMLQTSRVRASPLWNASACRSGFKLARGQPLADL